VRMVGMAVAMAVAMANVRRVKRVVMVRYAASMMMIATSGLLAKFSES